MLRGATLFTEFDDDAVEYPHTALIIAVARHTWSTQRLIPVIGETASHGIDSLPAPERYCHVGISRVIKTAWGRGVDFGSRHNLYTCKTIKRDEI